MKAKQFLFLSVFILSACGKPVSQDVSHNLAPSHSKDSPAAVACNTARSRVQSALGANSGVSVSTMSPPTGCAVSLTAAMPNKLLPALKVIKTKLGSYASVSANNLSVGLWPTVVTAAPPPPTLGKATPAPTKTVPVTKDLCVAAIAKIKTSQPLATVTSMPSGNIAVLRAPCYVDVEFHDDASFEAFFFADNPYSTTHDIFHIDFINHAGAVASVPIHVYRGIDFAD